MGTTAGVPPLRLPQDVHEFRKHLTPNHLTSRFPTAVTMLNRFPIALVPIVPLTFVLVQGLMRRGWVELFVDVWALWASHGSDWCYCWDGHHNLYLVQRKPSLFPLVLSLDRCARYGAKAGAMIFVVRVLEVLIARMGNSLDPKERDAPTL